MIDEFEFDEEDSELDQLWFDPWEGQIELSNFEDYKNDILHTSTDEILDELDELSELRMLTPLEKRRNSILRQKSLSVFNQPIYNVPSKLQDFHTKHTLFWQQHLDEGTTNDVSSECVSVFFMNLAK